MKYICKSKDRNIKHNIPFPYNTCKVCPHKEPHEESKGEELDKIYPKRLEPEGGLLWWDCVLDTHPPDDCTCIPYDLEYIMREIIKKHEENK